MNVFYHCIVGLSFLLSLIPPAESFFGLTARKSVLSMVMDLRGYKDNSIRRQPASVSTEQICSLLKLNKKQLRICIRDRGIAETLVEATRMSILECQFQFQYERWNCTLGSLRAAILSKGFKETAYMYAISSAALVHSFARSCSRGKIERCTCDESFNSKKTRETWKWGGCGDNIKFGQRFTKRLMVAAKKGGKDLRAFLDQHNSMLGMRLVRNEVSKTCKCHGVSGSCTVKTCWRQLAPFTDIGRGLKHKYEYAAKVVPGTNRAKGRRGLGRINSVNQLQVDSSHGIVKKSPRKSDMIYTDTSPTFCMPSKYSSGTSGRVCNKETNCASMCCGRGYNVQNRILKKDCQCRVIRCCYVECKTCLVPEDIYMCKPIPIAMSLEDNMLTCPLNITTRAGLGNRSVDGLMNISFTPIQLQG